MRESTIEAFADERFDHSLAADIQAGRLLIQFFKHFPGEINIYALNRIDHVAFVREEPADIFSLVRHAGNGLGTDGLLLTNSFHIAFYPPMWPSRESRDGKTPRERPA